MSAHTRPDWHPNTIGSHADPLAPRAWQTPHHESDECWQKVVWHCESNSHAPATGTLPCHEQLAGVTPSRKSPHDCRETSSAQLAILAGVAGVPGAASSF
jgi:hypothetical protein